MKINRILIESILKVLNEDYDDEQSYFVKDNDPADVIDKETFDGKSARDYVHSYGNSFDTVENDDYYASQDFTDEYYAAEYDGEDLCDYEILPREVHTTYGCFPFAFLSREAVDENGVKLFDYDINSKLHRNHNILPRVAKALMCYARIVRAYIIQYKESHPEEFDPKTWEDIDDDALPSFLIRREESKRKKNPETGQFEMVTNTVIDIYDPYVTWCRKQLAMEIQRWENQRPPRLQNNNEL